MTFPELLAELDRRHVTLEQDPDGKLIVEGPPRSIDDELAAALATHKVLVRWTVVAARTGHAWRMCDTCHQFRLVSAGNQPRSCNLTPHCGGQLTPIRNQQLTAEGAR